MKPEVEKAFYGAIQAAPDVYDPGGYVSGYIDIWEADLSKREKHVLSQIFFTLNAAKKEKKLSDPSVSNFIFSNLSTIIDFSEK